MAYTPGTPVHTANSGSGTTLTAAPTYVAHDEAFAVGTYGTDATVTETLPDTAGNTFVKIGTIRDSSDTQSLVLFYCKDCAAGTPTATFTLASAQSARGIWIFPFSGLDNTTTPVGGGQDQVAPGTGAGAVSSGNITPPAQPAVFGGFSIDTSGGESGLAAATGSGFTDGGNASSWESAIGIKTRCEHVRITATSAKSATFTATTGTGRFLSFAFTAPEGGGGGGGTPLFRISLLNGLGSGGKFFNNPIG